MASEQQEPNVSDAFAAAARRSTLGHLAEGEQPSGHAILAAMGGLRGLVESILPGLAFVVAFTVTSGVKVWAASSIPVSVGSAGALAVVFIAVRLAQRQPVTSAVAGLFGILLSAILALVTGKAANNYLLGFGIDAVLAAVMLVSILLRRPAIGVLAAVLSGTGASWRSEPAKRRVATIATWLWFGLGAARLAVQFPLYLLALNGNAATVALGTTKLIMGVPLYAGVLWVSWLLLRAAFPFGSRDDADGDDADGDESTTVENEVS